MTRACRAEPPARCRMPAVPASSSKPAHVDANPGSSAGFPESLRNNPRCPVHSVSAPIFFGLHNAVAGGEERSAALRWGRFWPRSKPEYTRKKTRLNGRSRFHAAGWRSAGDVFQREGSYTRRIGCRPVREETRGASLGLFSLPRDFYLLSLFSEKRARPRAPQWPLPLPLATFPRCCC